MKRLALTLTLALLTLAGCGGSGGSGEPPPAAPAPPVVPDPPVVPVAVDYWPSADQTDAFTLEDPAAFSWIDRLTLERYLDSPNDGQDGWIFSADWRCTYFDIVRYFQYRELVEWVPEGEELAIFHMERHTDYYVPRDEYEEARTLTHTLADAGALVLIPDTTDMVPGDVYTDTKNFDVSWQSAWTISSNPVGSDAWDWTERITATTTVGELESVTVGGVTYPEALPVEIAFSVESNYGGNWFGSRTTYWLVKGRGVVKQAGIEPWYLEYWNADVAVLDRVAP